MEQLTSDAVRQLLAKGLESVRPPGVDAGPEPVLWARRRRTAATAAPAGSLTAADAELAGLSGIERRLPRRAELLWEQLRRGAPMPTRTASARLLEAPFRDHALMVAWGGHGQAAIAFAGAELAALGGFRPGPIEPKAAPDAPIAERLAALAGEAVRHGEPRHLDSDLDPDLAVGRSPLLFRAVALPLAGEDGAPDHAIVVLSWRRLLSPGETADLHRELQSAIGWLSGAPR
jgi:hypothetical protein